MHSPDPGKRPSNAAGADLAARRPARFSYVWRLAALRLLDRLTLRRSLWVLERIVRLKP